ncbi:Transcriptional regulator, MarR family [Pediococcus damnosus]|uniref:Transcriptional regulator, MarR family n=1 Tax=Pediococcus damnosus TaxID=51663 RepID=A0A0R2HSZ6_9LACO|nr:MarR family winged helix-turn-helix transcriptional regulator [Pediococcus damnosus]AMV63085.1 Transcriptional regulator, MarR family [Pediococcus damnosus]AMV64760.1 Transcriptional regulator, MarR family [Pediococcus damnosus]AMV67024.1 Transcriptional regulator, MarR family [Pediococcus damnosus]AMV69376.1 Transcriptional regulator, MarR family [Pediococcus damnosus]KJU73421.1 transcriptional regulator [Pediococcus damnosus LMG 28219]
MPKFQQQLTQLSKELNQSERFYRQWAKQQGINYNQLITLYELYTQGQCTQKGICEIWIASKQTINTICNVFIKDGVIQISDKTNDDGRERLLKLTTKGTRLAKPIVDKLLALEADVSGQLGTETLKLLIKNMHKLNVAFDAHLEK